MTVNQSDDAHAQEVTGNSLRRISALWLRSTQLDVSSDFVVEHLPAAGQGSPANFAEVRFVTATPGASADAEGQLNSFWKFSIFTDDIIGLRAALIAGGHPVSEPVQFGEIGYLCHLEEPGGNSIELLQRTFRDHPPASPASPDTLGLITLRVTDLEASLRFYQHGLGMKLLATMAVDDGRRDPFDLYFLGWVEDPMPDPDVASVANREWLYQRRATLVELQHYRSIPTSLSPATSGPGLRHIELAVSDLDALTSDLAEIGVQVGAADGVISFASPDGHSFVSSIAS